MPRRRNYRRKKRYGYRRRRKRKRKWRRRPRAIAQGFASSFVKGRITKMVYHDRYDFTSTAGILSYRTLRCNSIFDPDYTGSGHFPQGYAQWALLYAQYMVVGARVNIRATFSETKGTTPYNYGVIRGISAAMPYSTAVDCIEESGKYRLFRGGVDTGVLRMGYSTRKMFNIKDPRDVMDRYGSLFGNNPTEQCYWHLWVVGDVADTAVARLEVTIEYIVVLSQPVSI